MFGWLMRGDKAGGGTRQIASRLRSLEAEWQRLEGARRREEEQFQRLVARPPDHLHKYDVIRWREERRRERDNRLADIRDRQAQLAGEIGELRRQLTPPAGAAD